MVADGRYDPAADQTAIVGTELARASFGQGTVSGAQLTMRAAFLTGAWQGYEVAVLDENDVLFAVMSDGAGGDVLLTKVVNTNLAVSVTLLLTGVPSGSVSVLAQFEASVDDATETQRGIAEIATQGETDAATDDERFVTPLKLSRFGGFVKKAGDTMTGLLNLVTPADGDDSTKAASTEWVRRRLPDLTPFLRIAGGTMTGALNLLTPALTDDSPKAASTEWVKDLTATTTRPGISERATQAEVIAGQDTQRHVTPAGLQAKTATETRDGIVELATVAEALEGTDNQRALTPEGARSMFRQFDAYGTVIHGPVSIPSGGTVTITVPNIDAYQFIGIYRSSPTWEDQEPTVIPVLAIKDSAQLIDRSATDNDLTIFAPTATSLRIVNELVAAISFGAITAI